MNRPPSFVQRIFYAALVMLLLSAIKLGPHFYHAWRESRTATVQAVQQHRGLTLVYMNDGTAWALWPAAYGDPLPAMLAGDRVAYRYPVRPTAPVPMPDLYGQLEEGDPILALLDLEPSETCLLENRTRGTTSGFWARIASPRPETSCPAK